VNPRAATQRDATIAELNAAIRELEDVAAQTRPIRGIGAERCANALYSIANDYRRIIVRLSNLG
jgi:hypothetical protein